MKRQLPAGLPRQHQLTEDAIARGRTTRALAIVALGLVLSSRPVQGQDGSRSYDLQLGPDVPSISAPANTAPSDAKTSHQLPAAIHELKRHSRYFVGALRAPENDPGQPVVFIFSNEQLSKIVVDSDRDQVENTRTVATQVEDAGILPWGLRRAGAGVRLTVYSVDVSLRRSSFTLSKSVTF